ncbi:MAG: HNH endonuclease [Bacteroidales bacterium]|nr:HNH endonuclease [Bacteroidales bacterium]
MEFVLSEYNRNIPNEELIEDVKKVAIKLKKNSVTIAEYEANGKYHPCTLQRRFGSWFKLMQLCELEPTRSKINISEEELFSNLENVWINLGRQPKYHELKKPLSIYSAGTYDKRFGSFRKALEEFVKYMSTETNTDSKTEDIHPQDNKTLIVHKTKREISDRLRFQILMRDGFTCKTCGRSPMNEMGVKLHVDHIIPWSKGGETVPENLETKCEQCNLGKGNAFNR